MTGANAPQAKEKKDGLFCFVPLHLCHFVSFFPPKIPFDKPFSGYYKDKFRLGPLAQ
jgi:hypothetical protein